MDAHSELKYPFSDLWIFTKILSSKSFPIGNGHLICLNLPAVVFHERGGNIATKEHRNKNAYKKLVRKFDIFIRAD